MPADTMSMSPEVQAFAQGAPGPDQTENLFTQKFNDLINRWHVHPQLGFPMFQELLLRF